MRHCSECGFEGALTRSAPFKNETPLAIDQVCWRCPDCRGVFYVVSADRVRSALWGSAAEKALRAG